MKAKWIALLAALLLLAACSGQDKELNAETVRQLIINDAEVEHIFGAAGLAVDGSRPLKDPSGNLYLPVSSEKYSTMAELQKLPEATYADAQIVAEILATADAGGAPLYAELEGKLCRSAAPVISLRGVVAQTNSIKLGQLEKDEQGRNVVECRLPEEYDDGTTVDVTLRIVQTKQGWRLERLRSRIASAEPPTQEQPGEIREVAERFLLVLTAGDGKAALEMCLSDPQGGERELRDYNMDFLADCGITAATITEVNHEDENSAEYLVQITSQSGQIFPAGSSAWVLELARGESAADGSQAAIYVSALWQRDDPPYNRLPFSEQSNRAIDQVSRLIGLHGLVQFENPSVIGNDMLSEYLLCELEAAQPENATEGYTLDEVKGMAERLLGDSGFVPAERFRGSDSDRYFAWGRARTTVNNRLRQREAANGLVVIESLNYNDPLQLRVTSCVVYTLRNNWNGTYQMVSAVLER